jgi:uncharacterized protein YbjT (DUF2867 family)
MTAGLVAVFGGTGFLGRRIVRHLRNLRIFRSDRVKEEEGILRL